MMALMETTNRPMCTAPGSWGDCPMHHLCIDVCQVDSATKAIREYAPPIEADESSPCQMQQ